MDVSRFAGREVEIQLATRPIAGRGPPTGIPLWSEPRLRTRGRESDAPNLLVISVDTLRADHLESYGYRHATSPTITRIAAEGVRFADCISHAPSTLPSHGALFTGIPALKNRVNESSGLRLPEARSTLAEILRERGFATAAIAGGAYFDPFFGLSQGFDTYAYAKSQRTFRRLLSGT